MKNKGFTLIELLAVIIILGLISLITIPKINNEIETSRKKTSSYSAQSYIKTINEYIIRQEMNKNEITLNGEYNINQEGYIFNEDITYEIEFSGTKPKNGTLTYLNNELNSACITINNYKITFENEEITNVEKGTCSFTKILTENDYKEFAQNYISLAREISVSEKIVKETNELNETLDINNKPTSGWIFYNENGDIIDYSLQFGNYIINYDMQVEKNNSIKNKPWIQTIFPITYGDPINGIQYYDKNYPQTVYYDPINTVKCKIATDNSDTTGYISSNSTKGYTGIIPNPNTNNQTTCLEWYAYSQFELNGKTYVNMILDHNINTKYVEWISNSDYLNPPSNLGVSYDNNSVFSTTRNNSKGPLTALAYIKNNLNHWKTNVIGNTYTVETTNSKYTINYNGYTARLITTEEVLSITNKTIDEIIANRKIPSWLNRNLDTTLAGYWTSTATNDTANEVWAVYNVTYFAKHDVNNQYRGIRPVITVPIEEIF